jgi:hypothetical protein
MKGSLLLPMCQRSKKWFIIGFPNSLHCFGHSSRIHFAIEVCLSETNDFIIIPVVNRKANARWCPRNSIAELLPASLAYKAIQNILINIKDFLVIEIIFLLEL